MAENDENKLQNISDEELVRSIDQLVYQLGQASFAKFVAEEDIPKIVAPLRELNTEFIRRNPDLLPTQEKATE